MFYVNNNYKKDEFKALLTCRRHELLIKRRKHILQQSSCHMFNTTNLPRNYANVPVNKPNTIEIKTKQLPIDKSSTFALAFRSFVDVCKNAIPVQQPFDILKKKINFFLPTLMYIYPKTVTIKAYIQSSVNKVGIILP